MYEYVWKGLLLHFFLSFFLFFSDQNLTSCIKELRERACSSARTQAGEDRVHWATAQSWLLLHFHQPYYIILCVSTISLFCVSGLSYSRSVFFCHTHRLPRVTTNKLGKFDTPEEFLYRRVFCPYGSMLWAQMNVVLAWVWQLLHIIHFESRLQNSWRNTRPQALNLRLIHHTKFVWQGVPTYRKCVL